METEETSIARQQLGKQVSTAVDTQATIEDLLETMFSIRSVQNKYKRLQLRIGSRVPEFQVSSYSRVGLCKEG